MNKDEIYELQIEDLSNEGEGIGHVNGNMAVFVKDAAVGDFVRVKIIKVKKSYAYGRLMEVIKPSPYRVRPLCENARRCGGCAIMHMSYDKQKEVKWNKVRDCLMRIGGIEDAPSLMEPVLAMENPYCYRNKMQFPIGLDRNKRVNIGFYAGRTHSIIDTNSCAIGHPVNNYLIKYLRKWLQEKADFDAEYIYDEKEHKGLIRHVLTRVGYTTGELMVCIVVNGASLATKKTADEKNVNASLVDMLNMAVAEYNNAFSDTEEIIHAVNVNCHAKRLELKSVSININREKTNRILGDKCKTIFGEDYITDYIGDVRFNISPLSFYQVNPVQTKVLYDKAVSYAALSGNEIVWDLYCGIGTISLSLAKTAKKVYGVEIVPQAIEDARKNAKINAITNTEFFCGKAEEVVPLYLKGELGGDALGARPDVIVVDPPRKGCDAALLETIVTMQPDRIVYVSCDPATLARDIKILTKEGFVLERVAVVDQFCHSVHVETVVLMSRAEK